MWSVGEGCEGLVGGEWSGMKDWWVEGCEGLVGGEWRGVMDYCVAVWGRGVKDWWVESGGM